METTLLRGTKFATASLKIIWKLKDILEKLEKYLESMQLNVDNGVDTNDDNMNIDFIDDTQYFINKLLSWVFFDSYGTLN